MKELENKKQPLMIKKSTATLIGISIVIIEMAILIWIFPWWCQR